MAMTRAIGKTTAGKFKKNQKSQLRKSRQQSNPASSNAAATEMQKSKKKKKKTRAAPAEEDGADQWNNDAQADDHDLRSASYGGFTDAEIGLSLELGTLVKTQLGKLTPETAARLVRTGLLGTPKPVGDRALPAFPPGLGLRPEEDDDCEFVSRTEVEKVLMAVLQHLIQAFELTPHLEKPLYMLSTGSKRKVWLAAAFASGAAVTLLDQPFAALDKASVGA